MNGPALVAYATKHGSTAEIAATIADSLRAAGLEVDVRPARDVDSVHGYQAAILGSAVYMNRWQGDALGLLKRHERALAAMPVWLFSSGPTGGTPEADAKVHDALVAQGPPPGDAGRRAATLRARGHATFGGRVGEEMTGLLERWMPRGDWRDFDRVQAWAAGIAAELSGAATEPVGVPHRR